MQSFERQTKGPINQNLKKLIAFARGDEYRERQFERAKDKLESLCKGYNKNKAEFEKSANDKNAISSYNSSLYLETNEAWSNLLL